MKNVTRRDSRKIFVTNVCADYTVFLLDRENQSILITYVFLFSNFLFCSPLPGKMTKSKEKISEY